MIRPSALWLALAALTALAGCDVLAPIVGERPTPGTGREPPCDPAVVCARLADPPPRTLEEETLAPPRAACAEGWTSASLTMREDLTLQAEALRCVDLEVTALASSAPGDPSLRTLTIEGGALTSARIRLTSSGSLVALAVRARALSDSTLRADGAVRVGIVDANAQRVEFVLGGGEPIDPPELLVTGGSLGNVRIVGLRSSVRLRDTRTSHSALAARSITLERGEVADALLAAELVELLDVSVSATRFSSDRMIVGGGRMDASNVERCGSLTLAATQVIGSTIAACSEATDLETASIGGSLLYGDLRGSHALLARSVLGGRSIHVVEGILTDVALCGTDTLRAGSLSCGRCEPGAPSEVCLDGFERVTECPGLCAATCAVDRAPSIVEMELCAE